MRAALLLSVLLPAADPQPRVKVELSPKDGAWVGQRVTLAITLSTPDLFAGVPSFDMPPIPGVVVLPPAGSPAVGSETVGDISYTTQRHEFAVYAQRAGVVRIPPFPIRFESNAGFGKPTVRRQVATDEVSFTAKAPPGTEKLGTVIVARDLKVTDEWTPEPEAPKVGDAFTRTVTVTAADVPGMVFPPLHFSAIDGLAAYPKAPVVDDRTDRGTLTGRRVESVTYVCERPTAVTVPDRTLTWWDLDAKELRTVKLPGRRFEVAPDPNAPPDPPPAPATTAGRSSWWVVPAVGVALLAAWRLLGRILQWWARRQAACAESEPAYFERVGEACRAADPHGAYVALLKWLDRYGPMSLDEFTVRASDPALTEAVGDLERRVYAASVEAGPWLRVDDLADRLTAARRRLGAANRSPTLAGALPPLNPPG